MSKADSHASRMAGVMGKAFGIGVVSAILMMLSGGLGFMPGVIVTSLVALGANVFAAYAINRARLVTNRFPVTHPSRAGRSRGDVTAGLLAVLALLMIGLWVSK